MPKELILMSEKNDRQPCFFTTDFLNGLFSAVRNQRFREIECIAVADPTESGRSYNC